MFGMDQEPQVETWLSRILDQDGLMRRNNSLDCDDVRHWRCLMDGCAFQVRTIRRTETMDRFRLFGTVVWLNPRRYFQSYRIG